LAIIPERGKVTSWGDHRQARGAVTRWMEVLGTVISGERGAR
jgi:hypothetical protein